MIILFVGDVVGPLGVNTIAYYLPELKRKYKPQVTIVNGENSSNHGRGISIQAYKKIKKSGADVVTLGNHAFDNDDVFDLLETEKHLVRPANFYNNYTPGSGMTFINVNDKKLAVINLQGTALMDSLGHPFEKIDQLLAEAKVETNCIFIDFHAETTSEKLAMGWYVAGRASAIVGTHTHIQTNDARILKGSTAYLTDVGMTGAYNSVIGMQTSDVLQKFTSHLPTRFNVENDGPGQINACVVEIDEQSGKAISIELIQQHAMIR